MNKLKLRVPKDIRQLYTIFKRNGKKYCITIYILLTNIRFSHEKKNKSLRTKIK